MVAQDVSSGITVAPLCERGPWGNEEEPPVPSRQLTGSNQRYSTFPSPSHARSPQGNNVSSRACNPAPSIAEWNARTMRGHRFFTPRPWKGRIRQPTD
jgi:hypothetical protein